MDDYIPVRLKTIRPDSQIHFDLYVKIGQKFVHYIRNNDEIEKNRIDNLKSKKVRKLFIPYDQEDNYLTYLDTGLDQLSSDKLNLDEKAELVHDSMVTAAENAEKTFESEKGYQQTQDRFEKITDFLMSDSGAIKKIMEAAGSSVDNHQHAATVSSLSLGLATATGFLSSNEMFELGIAALVHELGKNKLPFDPMTPKEKLSGEDLKLYEQHPNKAVSLLAGKPYISPKILQLIGDHEEVGVGQGFPNKKDLTKLSLPQQILNLCNAFDEFCYQKGLEHKNGLEPFKSEKGDLFDSELFNMLWTMLL